MFHLSVSFFLLENNLIDTNKLTQKGEDREFDRGKKISTMLSVIVVFVAAAVFA